MHDRVVCAAKMLSIGWTDDGRPDRFLVLDPVDASMRIAVGGLLVVVVLVATTGLVVGTTSPPAITSDSVLEPPPGEYVSIDATAATADFGVLAVSTETILRTHQERILLERAVEAEAGNSTAAAAHAEAYFDRLDAELDGFDEHTRELLRAPRQERADAPTVLRHLVEQHHRATVRLETLDRLEPIVGHYDDADRLEDRYALYTARVREVALNALVTPDGGRAMTIEASNESVMLATIADGAYQRETLRLDRRSTSGSDRIKTLEAAEAIVRERYPDSTATRSLSRLGEDVYLVTRETPWGSFDAYVDGTFEDVFLERHRHWLDRVDTGEPEGVERNGVTLEAHRTFASGPMQVVVRDAEGDPLEASVFVRVSGRWTPLGSTGSSGTLWTVEPSADFELRVVTEHGIATLGLERS